MEKVEAEKILNLFEHFERLKNTPRTGFNYFGIKHPETVAEHSYLVAFMALILANIKKERGENIDIERVLSMAILHEVGEVLIGDLHKMTRKYVGNDIVEKAEDRVAVDLLSVLPAETFEKLLNIYREFNERKTKEAKFVASLDKLELLLYVYLLETWGHGGLDAFFSHKGNADLITDNDASGILKLLLEKRENTA